MSYKCPHDPTNHPGALGMYHCPECGLMVLNGYPHPLIRRYRVEMRDGRIWRSVDITDRPDLWGDADEFDYEIPEDEAPDPEPEPIGPGDAR